MAHFLVEVYRAVFARQAFYCFNKLLYRCSLSALGIFNYENARVSGEDWFLRSYLKNRPHGLVLDVGANQGDYSKGIIQINPNIKIYAFEPHPKTFSQLIKTIQSPSFYPVNSAVGDKNGQTILYDYAENDGSAHASLYPEVIATLRSSAVATHTVNAITLDSFIKDKNIQQIDLLKIDVEGNELKVLIGLGENIRNGKVKAIHFEFNEMNVYSRTFFRDFWELLPIYDLYRLLPRGMIKIDKYDPRYTELFAYQNIVALLK